MDRLALILLLFSVTSVCLGATANVEIHMNGPGNDIVFLNDWNTMEIWIENSDVVYAMLLSLELSWTGSHQVIILDEGHGGECGCDFISANDCYFWATDLFCWQTIDDRSPDGFKFGGTSIPLNGIPAGESRLLYSVRFFFAGPSDSENLCVRPYAFGAGTNWEFCCSPSGYTPDFNDTPVLDSENPDVDPICFEVESVPQVLCGDVNCSDRVDIDDVVYLVNYIFGGGPAPCDGCD